MTGGNVPDTWAQMRTSPPASRRPRLACVFCQTDIASGSWCTSCVGRDEDGDCECGRPRPRRVKRCSRCTWLEKPQTVRPAEIETAEDYSQHDLARMYGVSRGLIRLVVTGQSGSRHTGRGRPPRLGPELIAEIRRLYDR